MPLPPVFVELKANVSEFTAKMTEAKEQVEKLEKKGASSFDRLATVGKAALIGVAGAGVALGGMSLEMADRFEQSHARLETAIRNTGRSFDELRKPIAETDKHMESFGFTNAETEDALAKLTVATKNPATAMKYMGTVADLARFKNIDLASAAEIVGKAFAGQTRGLKQLGIDLPIATGGAMALQAAQNSLASAQHTYNNALDAYNKKPTAKNEKELAYAKSQLEYYQTRLNEAQNTGVAVIDALNQRIGGSAQKNAQTFAGRMQSLKASSEDVAKNIGMALIPILEKLMDATSDVIKWFKDHSTVAKVLAGVLGGVLSVAIAAYTAKVAKAAVDTVRDFGQMISKGVAWAAENGKAFVSSAANYARDAARGAVWVAEKSAQYAATAAASIASAAASAAAWVAANATMLLATGGILLLLAALAAGAYELYKHWDQVWGFVKAVVKDAWDWIKKHAELIITVALGPIGIAVLELYKHWDTVWSGIKTVVKDVWDFVKPIFDDIRRGVEDVTKAIGSVAHIAGDVTGGIGKIGSLFKGVFADGGIVPGSGGQGVPIVAHPGELILNAAQQGTLAGLLAAGGGGGGGVTVEAHFYLDGREIYPALQQQALRTNMRNGANRLALT